MTKLDLKELLIQNNIQPDSYSLEGGLPNEAYCLSRESDVWEVYYSERGNKTALRKFSEEEDACNYFFKLLTK